MQNDRDRLIKIILEAIQNEFIDLTTYDITAIADYLLANDVFILPEDLRGAEDFSISAFIEAMQMYKEKDRYIKPPCKVGNEIWVIDREDGEAVDISCIQFLAKSEDCIIGTARINDLDIDGTIEYHINETQENFGTDLMVYPDEDCFLTKEEAEQALKERESGD